MAKLAMEQCGQKFGSLVFREAVGSQQWLTTVVVHDQISLGRNITVLFRDWLGRRLERKR